MCASTWVVRGKWHNVWWVPDAADVQTRDTGDAGTRQSLVAHLGRVAMLLQGRSELVPGDVAATVRIEVLQTTERGVLSW